MCRSSLPILVPSVTNGVFFIFAAMIVVWIVGQEPGFVSRQRVAKEHDGRP